MFAEFLTALYDALRRGSCAPTPPRRPLACHRVQLLKSYVDTIVVATAAQFKTGSPDVHGRPRFAKLSVRDCSKEKIAPVHSDFCCESSSLSLMGSAGRRLDRLHALWVPRLARALPTTV